MRDYCSRTFRHVAEGKSLDLTIEIGSNVPAENLHTDAKRLQQVLKNLLSNALKFTEQGSVQLQIDRAADGWSPSHPVLNRAKSVIAFSVTDTGIGIPQDKQKIIFEAFQQADGTTSRKYGGTGLGLSISRELARLLGGEIRLQSAPGVGSTFTLYLPLMYMAVNPTAKPDGPRAASIKMEPMPAAPPALQNGGDKLDVILPAPVTSPQTLVEDLVIDDDRNMIQPEDPVLLIVEDDITFARILVDMAHERNLKALVALRGGTALSLAREFKPGAITLDIKLPDMAGWTILDRLKHDPATRHIPVHIISGDENRRRGLALGAMSYLEKSLTKDSLARAFTAIENSVHRRARKLLIVTSDQARRVNLEAILAARDVEIVSVSTGGEALATMRHQYLDGLIVDLRLADISATQLVEEIQAAVLPQVPPIILYSKRNASESERAEIQRLARTSLVLHTQSAERVLYETAILLHRDESELSAAQREIIAEVHRKDDRLAGRRVLVVDDDLRNIFALTSVLEQHNLRVSHAENGRAGIELLKKNPGIDIVLMDIMMPEMDGYQTIAAIREIPELHSLPIIALTAKAMKGDREKCIEAGASDYIAKPVDLEQLFSVMRVWLARGGELVMNA